MIDHLFFYLVTPPFPAKKAIVRYRFQVQLGTTAVLFYGTVCPLLLGKQILWLTFDRCFKAFQLTDTAFMEKRALIFLSSFRFYITDICLFLLLSYICIYIIVHRFIKSL